jgi:hypothetical protein
MRYITETYERDLRMWAWVKHKNLPPPRTGLT